MSKIRIYACGGTGANIATRFLGDHNKENTGFAKILISFIDTSRSNLPDGVPDEQVFLFQDNAGDYLDGNGKKRSNNYDIISQANNINGIIHRFKPENLNIVIHSGGGGTGSVSGPLLARELISRGQNVIVMLVGSTTSKVDVENTVKTLKTYENLSTKLENPINVLYRENNSKVSRANVDSDMEKYIFLLAAFFSGQNKGLDTSDLRNFLKYNEVTNFPARMTAIELFRGPVKLPEGSVAISAVSLTADNSDSCFDFLVSYEVSGIISSVAYQRISSDLPLHAVTFSGYFPAVLSRLDKLIKQHVEQEKLLSKHSIMSDSDIANKDDVIL